jgi:rhodanese-related sulfurtransferase
MKFVFFLVCFTPGLLLAQNDTSMCIHRLEATDFYIQSHAHVDGIILDVREFKFFKKSRIHGAINVPNSTILKTVSDTLDRELPIFVYCDGSTRSHTACSLLMEKRFKNVYLLNEGFLSWKAAQLPIDKERIRRRRSHTQLPDRDLHQ